MIVERISTSLAKRDWTTVLVELSVVVIGIFLGLQASNWNDARKAEADGYFYLDLLERQLTDIIRRDDEHVALMTETNAQVEQVAKLLYADTWTDEEFQQFKDRHWSIYVAFRELQRPHALRQLLDAGKIDLVRSRHLQERLFEFDAEYEGAIQQYLATDHYVTEAVHGVVAGIPYGTAEDLSAIPVSHEALLDNGDLKSAVRVIAIMNGLQLDALYRLQDSRREFRDELEAFLTARGYSRAND
jgi:hypothetical protein